MLPSDEEIQTPVPGSTRGRGGRLPKALKAKIAFALGTGMSVREAAKECDVSPSSIHTLVKDDEFRELLEQVEDTATQTILAEVTIQTKQRLKEMQARATEVLSTALESDDQRVALQAAGMVLRGGGALGGNDVNVKVGIERLITGRDPSGGD